MFTRFNSSSKTIFLDPNSMDRYQLLDGEKVAIVLSPSLYWVKKVSLPVKYLRDIKKLLPSLFEETLPSGNYNYSAYKYEDQFYIFAYEDKIILDTLAKVGISASNVKNVYFAQSELQHIQSAMKINETQSVYIKDGIVILVPCCWIEEGGELNLSDIALSRHNITLQQYGHIIDNSSFKKIGIVLSVMITLIFIQYIITIQKTKKILKSKDEIFSTYHLKPTTFQNRSMLARYENIHNKQTKLREYISYLISLKLKGMEKLSKLNFKDKSLYVELSGASKQTLQRIEKLLVSKEVKYSAKLDNKTLHLEIEL